MPVLRPHQPIFRVEKIVGSIAPGNTPPAGDIFGFELLGSAAFSTAAAGAKVAVSGNYAYVTCFSPPNVVSFDISDPANPVELDTQTDATLQLANGIAVSGSHAFVADEDGDQLFAVDISDPANLVFEASAVALGGKAFDVVIVGTVAYVLGYLEVTAVDISDPTAMTILDTYTTAHEFTYGGVALSSTVLLVASTDVSETDTILETIDISTPSALTNIDTLTVTTAVPVVSVSMSGTYALLVARDATTVTAVDASAPAALAPVVGGSFAVGSGVLPYGSTVVTVSAQDYIIVGDPFGAGSTAVYGISVSDPTAMSLADTLVIPGIGDTSDVDSVSSTVVAVACAGGLACVSVIGGGA